MSIPTPNPTTRAQSNVTLSASPVLHPDYVYWQPLWEMIRDAEIGEVEIKRKGKKYLPKLKGQDEEQYAAYLNRAVFFNMTAKTLNSLYGTVFRRNPKVFGFDKKMTERSRRFSKDGMSLHLTAKMAVKEVLSVGRYGMLVDADQEGRGGAYVACYTTENILDWQLEEVNGEWKFTRVVLREMAYARDDKFSPYQFTSRFRVLVLSEIEEDTWLYEQHIYDHQEGGAIPDMDQPPDDIIIPTVRGDYLSYIPFVIVGPFTNHPNVQKPPILDIVTLNYSHYSSYAELESGRFYTANPVYTVSGGSASDEAAGDYYVGPDVVWELGQNGQAAILEFQGHGLRFLENALHDKEAQISAIGGRMMPGTGRGAAESDNSLRMKEQNEQTLLLNISDTIDEAFTTILRWWADWMNVSASKADKITFEVNRDFLLKDIGAREFRAIHQMYADGVIPIDVVFNYLSKAEVIPDWMDNDEFMVLVQDAKQYPHMVDVLARMQNFPDAKSFHEFRVLKEEQAQGMIDITPEAGDPDSPPVPAQARASQQLRTPRGRRPN